VMCMSEFPSLRVCMTPPETFCDLLSLRSMKWGQKG
jgi:hypothetical protein